MSKLTVVNSTDGSMHVHAAGCADITRRELKNANGWFEIDASSEDGAVRDIWQDFAAEWEGDFSTGRDETRFFPCVKF